MICRILAGQSHIDCLEEVWKKIRLCFRLYNIQLYSKIYGYSCVKGLAALLPKTRELERPPLLPEKETDNLKKFNYALCYFINKKEEALNLVKNETVNIVERLLPFLIFRGESALQEQTAHAIYKICSTHEYSKGLVKKYLEKYGSEQIKGFNTSLLLEIQKYPKLRDFFD